jgi:hypothetical protein
MIMMDLLKIVCFLAGKDQVHLEAIVWQPTTSIQRGRTTEAISSPPMEKPHSFCVEEDDGWAAFSLVPPMPNTESLSHRIRVDDDAGAAEAE